MKKIISIQMLLVLILCAFLGATTAQAENAEESAILIVAFGTSVEKARVSYAKVEEQVRAAFPGRDVRWAWTAHSLLKSGPQPVQSTQEALAQLATEGVKNVAVLSLHIIPGAEYNNVARTAQAFQGLPKGLRRIRLSAPLLYDAESVRETAEVLLKTVPKARKPEEAVLFVGHGTHHPAGVYYPALQYYLSTLDGNAFVGTVEGDLDIEAVTAALKARGVKKVWLAPLMTVAGDHALNDLFGDEKDSWKQHLLASGIQVEAVAKGLGEYPEVIALWVNSLKKIME